MNSDNLVLRPNCLMTKYPLVFLTGIRSLFFYEKLGGPLQEYIAAHGYVVFSPVLPFRSGEARKTALLNWLKLQGTAKFHFILSQNTNSEFHEVLRNYQSSTFTVTNKDLYKYNPEQLHETISYKLHRLFCATLGATADPYYATLPDKSTEFYDRFLDRCVELAENESI